MISTRGADADFRLLNALHRFVRRVSAGRIGQVRPTILTVPVVEGTTLVPVASKGDDNRDPEFDPCGATWGVAVDTNGQALARYVATALGLKN